MRLDDQRESENVDDRRFSAPQMVAGGAGLGTLLIVVLGMVFGFNPQGLLGLVNGGPGAAPAAGPAQAPPKDDPQAQMVSRVLASTEDVWSRLLPEIGKTYKDPKLVLFSDRVNSACGQATASVGPFYCPGDQQVYIDLAFYDELDKKFGAPGDFAQAYVVAHEVGHHIQNLLGITGAVDRQRGKISQTDYNQLSVRLELQADYLAGVWAHHAQKEKNILEKGDVEEGLKCATAIGDDRLQKQAQGYVVPDSFTHGSSDQRVRWFRKGLQTGDVKGLLPNEGGTGDTFSASQL